MRLSPNDRSLQLVREVEYNWNGDNPEYPSIDGFFVRLRNGVSAFYGIGMHERSQYVLKPGQNGYYCYQFEWNEDWLTVFYVFASTVQPPPFAPRSENFIWNSPEVAEVYLCLWNWGYSGYDPEMDLTFHSWLIYYSGSASERPKVMNL